MLTLIFYFLVAGFTGGMLSYTLREDLDGKFEGIVILSLLWPLTAAGIIGAMVAGLVEKLEKVWRKKSG